MVHVGMVFNNWEEFKQLGSSFVLEFHWFSPLLNRPRILDTPLSSLFTILLKLLTIKLTSASSFLTLSSSELAVKAMPFTGGCWSSFRSCSNEISNPTNLSNLGIIWVHCTFDDSLLSLKTLGETYNELLNKLLFWILLTQHICFIRDCGQLICEAPQRFIFLHPQILPLGLKMTKTSPLDARITFKVVHQCIPHSLGRFTPLNNLELVNK